ncbi:MAG TPA: sugar kinase [Solirubrobacteraceae bacterium]|nr:sugar kinase [Solirubrobacteraceae bacterium]
MRRLDAVAIGEPLIAFVGQQADVPLVEIPGYGVHVTGAELNAAVGLARLGHAVAFAGRVGSDPFGAVVRRRLAMEAVDTRWLTDDERPTGLLFRNLRRTAPAEVVYRRAGSAGSCLTRADIEPAVTALPERGLVVITGVTAAVCPGTTRELIELARTGQRRLCVDLNYRARLWRADQAAPALRQLAAAAYLVAGSLEEARLITGLADAGAAAQALLSAGAQIVVLRHDVVAASWFSPQDPEPVTVRSTQLQATDPVGAGDAFMAGLISGLLEFGASAPEACLTRAHHCGAAVIATAGDLEGALHRDELRALESGAVGSEPLR